MLGTGTTRPQPDAPDQADDLVGYLRRGPRELPPGIPGAPDLGRPRPIISALACVAALAGLLVGCQIVKQAPTHSASASPSHGQPSQGATSGQPSHGATGGQPSPGHTGALPSASPHATSTLPPTPAPGGALPALPATSSQLSVEVSARVFAAGTVRIRVVASTPQAHTLEQTLTGAISVAPDGTLVGNAVATADRYNGVHVRAPAIFLPRSIIYFAPPADLMPAGKTWALITPAVPNGRASYAAREAAYVLYASATSWNLIRYATYATRPHWSGTGASARANMSGTVALANALPHATPGARDAVITFAGPGTKNATWHVMLDSRLLPVSCVITAYSPELGPIKATVTYSDWGIPVHASAPPAPQVATYSELPPYLREVTQ
jgi:hypothetical protein